ncbi:MAG TPA: hypothetical protein DCM28_11545 [Phycisphaerales bacterium]|nr:hypothetical protein [Phycisphaerales bacterium]|tara:strand:+ start:1665 stop:2855 length:1191 start_codon:yes stop_codon:yes gene_type:complete
MITEPAVNHTFKRVLTYIRQNQLGDGDRLPTQSQMVESLGVGSNVLQSAMKRLESEGFIQRKPRMGTIFNTQQTAVPIDWMVGILTPTMQNQHSPYYAVFLEMVLTRLIEKGCRYRIYNFDRFPHKPVELSEYNKQFSSDLDNGHLDALITPALSDAWFIDFCAMQKLELATVLNTCVNTHPQTSCLVGGAIDYQRMIHQAVDLLKDNECQRICLVSDDGPSNLGSNQWESFVASIQKHNLKGMEIHAGHGLILAGRKIGRALLELPKHQRPDGLIITNDDHICLGLTDVLKEQTDYRPIITVYGCHQAPLSYAMPVYRFEYDLAALVNATVHRLLHRLQGTDMDVEPELFAPQLNPAGLSAVPPQWDVSPKPPQLGVLMHEQPKLNVIDTQSIQS